MSWCMLLAWDGVEALGVVAAAGHMVMPGIVSTHGGVAVCAEAANEARRHREIERDWFFIGTSSVRCEGRRNRSNAFRNASA